MKYLVFRMYGPMASWGEIAVGESRHSAGYPGKSAITGLLGAALGIGRSDDTEQHALANGYALAVKMSVSGALLTDYHTTQVPDSTGKFRYRTRRDELVTGKDRLGTILSSREYFTDSVAIVAVRAVDQAAWSLEQLQKALLKPKFHLYLGRKACPLAAPLQPQIVDAEGFLAAFDDYVAKPLLQSRQEWVNDNRYLKPDATCHYYWQGDVADFADQETVPQQAVHKLVRHDQPLSRQRWQFQPRTENLWLQSPPTGGDK